MNKSILIVPVLIISIVLISLAGCAGTGSPARGGQPPLWLSNKDAVYPVDEFLAELGEGDSLSEAKGAAAGAIAQIFRTRITVDSTVRTRYTEMTGQEGEILGIMDRTDVDQSIGQSADESIVNLRYGESWISDDGMVYTIAYLNRAETGRLYRQRIIENDKRIASLRQTADYQDDPLRRFAYLDAALVSAEVNRVLIEQLEIISPAMAGAFIPSFALDDLRRDRSEQARGLRIRVEVFGDSDGRIGALLDDWITKRGFSSASEANLFLSGMASVSRVQLDNEYVNLGWELNLSLLDFFGLPAVTEPLSGRSSGISESAAEARVYSEMSEGINRDFDRSFSEYLDSFLDK